LAIPQARPSADTAVTPVTEVFTALADELERARTLGLRVEGAICAIAVRAAIDGSVIAELQQLDAVLQHIGALRDYAAEVARACDARVQIDTRSALDRVTLGDVRGRLAGEGLGDDDGLWEML
jgi:hypothetical protein